MAFAHKKEIALFGEEEMGPLVKIFSSISIDEDSESFFEEMEFLNSFSGLIQKTLALKSIDFSRQDRPALMLFMDKLNDRKELLKSAGGKRDLLSIRKAGERLGRKSQSAFGDPE